MPVNAQSSSGSTVPGGVAPRTASVEPFGVQGTFVSQLDATIGSLRPGATVRRKVDLDRIAYYRFIYGDSTTTGNGTDGLYGNYRSRRRDYSGAEPRSLHVMTPDSLVLTARRSDCGNGNVESGILRFALPICPGKANVSVLNWPPEIDIFDQFGFNNTPPGRYLITGTPTNGNDAAYGNPHGTFRHPEWGDK